MTKIRYSGRHSRNVHDWTVTTMDGRHMLEANRKGVRRRNGLMMTRMGKGPMTVGEMLRALQKTNLGYNRSDIVHGFKRLVEAGMVRKGQGRGAPYELTRMGMTQWMMAEKVFFLD